eukprot:7331226-Heterocapsa_arctica.AAC.1
MGDLPSAGRFSKLIGIHPVDGSSVPRTVPGARLSTWGWSVGDHEGVQRRTVLALWALNLPLDRRPLAS